MHVHQEFLYSAGASICAVIGAYFDIRYRRLPNLLTGPTLLLALILHLSFDGWHGMLSSLSAGLICGCIFLIFYLAGGMGAGDVKLITGLGCFVGLSGAPFLLIFTALAGGVMAMGLAVMRGRVSETFSNVGSLVQHHANQGLAPHPDLNVRNEAQLRLPYGVAILVGSLLTILLHQAQG